jgi:hypothetical protein
MNGTSGIDVVTPFQGLKIYCHETQGVALGCHVVALSARQMRKEIVGLAR